MDPILTGVIDTKVPHLNPDLANGLASIHMKRAASYVNKLIESVARYFPPNFKYVRWWYCSPLEEFAETTKRRSLYATIRQVSRFDLARSDTRMLAYEFQHTDMDGKITSIVRYLNIPFINHSGTMHINNVRFTINPVLCDKVISVSTHDVFVKLNLDKLTFKSQPVFYIADGKRESVNIVYSRIYKQSKTKKTTHTVKAHTTMMHYLFCKYGFAGTFQRAIGFVPVIGYDEVNESSYPSNQWVICSSIGLKPTTLKLAKTSPRYVPTVVRLAIPRELYTQTAKQYIAAFFYIVDHWPERFKPDTVEMLHVWKQAMGELILGDGVPLGRLETKINEHLTSIENYIDVIMKLRFDENDINVDNIYQLFMYVCDNFANWTVGRVSELSNMYNKQLEILYYALRDIREGINRFYLNLSNTMNKKGEYLSCKEIEQLLIKSFRTRLANRLSDTTTHSEVSTLDSSSDCKAFKTTLQLVPQDATGNTNLNVSYANPSRYLHASVAEVNAYLSINKTDPTGHNRLNPCLNVDTFGNIIRNEELRPLMDRTQEGLTRDVSYWESDTDE